MRDGMSTLVTQQKQRTTPRPRIEFWRVVQYGVTIYGPAKRSLCMWFCEKHAFSKDLIKPVK